MNSIEVLKKSLETSFESDYILIIISLFFCILSSFILSYVYKNKSNSLSSKVQLSTIIPLLANITFLVILIVKSSLALSLGLVGALSVIRFRTPVKEPEDLVFLFFAIALGIGYGETKIIECYDFFKAIQENKQPSPNFEDGYIISKIADCIIESSEKEEWIKI